jgi:glycosyltransferase involved in cell wall biosynthesis
MEPLVSVLIPAYNAQQWIGDTLESALAQTWPKKEIIVVDDGSSDRTLETARRFASRTVQVVSQRNQGASVARNTAFSLCQGDYIQWLDADDLLSRDKVAKQMEAAEKAENKRTLLSSGWGYFLYRPAKARFIPTALWCDLSPLEWLLRKWEGNLHMQTATWLVSRELTEAAGPFDTQLLVDNDGEYFFRVIRASGGVKFVPDASVFYRDTNSNRVSYIGRSNKKLEAKLLGMKMQIGYLRAMEDSERVRAACLNYLQTWLGNFYPQRPDLVEQAQQLAIELGGKLEMPHLRWKYAWLQPIFGYDFAKRAQLALPKIKWSMAHSWDKALFRLENRNASKSPRYGAKLLGNS